MKTRVITAVIFAAVGIPIILLSDYIIFPLAAAILSLVAVIEMLRVLDVRKSYLVAVPSYIIALLLPFFAFKDFSPFFTGIFGGSSGFAYLIFVALVFFAFLMYMAFAAVFARGKVDVKDISAAFMSVVYLVTSFVCAVLARYMEYGFYLFILLLIIPWGCDIAAYFIGTLFGKHKLIPEVSPKKTVEGAIGGVIIASGLSVLFGFIVSLIDSTVSVNYLILALLGLGLSIISQLGDLWASIIKRQNGVKDYGNFFPGHGGVVDRFDSMLAICMMAVLLCSVFPPFTAV